MLPRICHLFRLKYILLGLCIVFLIDFFGIFTHFFEDDFYTTFHYPLDDPNVIQYAKQIRNGNQPDVAPINGYNYSFLSNCRHKCRQAGEDEDILIAPRLVFIVKSAMHHFDRRNAIRQSWGFEKRFSDVLIRTVFILGVGDSTTTQHRELQASIDSERDQYMDIVQIDFIDTYFNNTIKTMMAFRWAIEFCPRSRFFMFVDDDFLVSTKNVLRFLRNPVNYPEYLEDADETLRKLARRLSQSDLLSVNQSINGDSGGNENNDLSEIKNLVNMHSIHTINNKEHVKTLQQYLSKVESRKKEQIERAKAREVDGKMNSHAGNRKLLDTELPYDVKLFSGFVFSSYPHRHKSSKWYVSLSEYRWHMWPPYVTAGAFILSREALIEMYYMSMYTKHFR